MPITVEDIYEHLPLGQDVTYPRAEELAVGAKLAGITPDNLTLWLIDVCLSPAIVRPSTAYVTLSTDRRRGRVHA